MNGWCGSYAGAIKSTGAQTATVAGTRPVPKGADLGMRLPLGGRLTLTLSSILAMRRQSRRRRKRSDSAGTSTPLARVRYILKTTDVSDGLVITDESASRALTFQCAYDEVPR